MSKRIAHCIPHTHWDPFWYFTAQDSMVVFAYNMKEMIRAFRDNEISYFFLDGQTVAIDEYLEIHPEDREKVENLIRNKKLVIGPFNSQLDCFITCGESVINNLKIGIENGDELGGAGRIAYLADPFGQSVDFPKIFNQMGIHEFVFTRGVNDNYGLDIDFEFKSNDGSTVLAHTLLGGYGYGHYAFKDGTLFSKDALDYNKIDVQEIIDRLVERSALKNEFVFPLGFDQNPIMTGIQEKMDYYNKKFSNYLFKLTSWENYFKHVRENVKHFKVWDKEILGGQYHRIHISGMNSCRSDIKAIQDQAERVLTYQSQPLMTMLDSLGIPYDRQLLKKAWYTLVNCQTHASATHIDETNAYIKNNSKEALSTAIAIKVYLMRLIAESLDSKEGMYPLVIFNTLPWKVRKKCKLTIITKTKDFELLSNGEALDYTIIKTSKENADVVRKDTSLMNPDYCFYKTDILVDLGEFNGISYRTFDVIQCENVKKKYVSIDNSHIIENEKVKISYTTQGIDIFDKEKNKLYQSAIYLEESGDAGDTYDYDYPDNDWILYHNFENCYVESYHSTLRSKMKLKGSFVVPKDLDERNRHDKTAVLDYELILTLDQNSKLIKVEGKVNNTAKNHRLRIVFKTGVENDYSYAGTQFGYVKRKTIPEELSYWKEKNFFEEPSTTKPLLNHVSSVREGQVWTLFTRSLKEYDFIGEGCTDIAATILRSCGYVGLPDLNRRPGRPSGLSNKILEAPEAQMQGWMYFELGWKSYDAYDANKVMNDYVRYATDEMYYQNQRLDKTVFPISYFPINKWKSEIPRQFNMLTLETDNVSFGTLIKSKDEKGYILRIFNAENDTITKDELKTFIPKGNTKICNLLDEIVDENPNEDLRSGELRNIWIEKKEG